MQAIFPFSLFLITVLTSDALGRSLTAALILPSFSGFRALILRQVAGLAGFLWLFNLIFLYSPNHYTSMVATVYLLLMLSIFIRISRVDLKTPLAKVFAQKFEWHKTLCITLMISITVYLTVFTTIPPFEWDEVAYGAFFPKVHVERGFYEFLPTHGLYSAFSVSFHTFSILGLFLFKNLVFGKLISIWFGFLLISSPFLFFNNCQKNIFAFGAALTLCVSGTIVGNLSFIKPDITIAIILLHAFFYISLTHSLNFENNAKAPLTAFFTVGFLLGVASSVKLVAIPSVLFLLGYALYLQRPLRKTKFKNIFLFLVGGMIGYAPVGLNLFLTFNNPVFPLFSDFLNSGQQQGFIKEHWQMLDQMNWGMKNYSFNSAVDYYSFLDVVGQFIPLAIILLLIGATLFLFKRTASTLNQKDYRDPLIFSLVILVTSFFFLFWNARFLIFPLTLLIIALFLLLEHACANSRFTALTGHTRNIAIWRVFLTAMVCFTINFTFQHKRVLYDFVNAKNDEEFIHEHTPFGKVVKYLNPLCGDNGVLTNIQPFYHLRCNSSLLHPLNPVYSQFLSTDEAVNSKTEFLKNISYVAIELERPLLEKEVYTSGNSMPIVFSTNYVSAIQKLSKTNTISKIHRIGSVTIYRVN